MNRVKEESNRVLSPQAARRRVVVVWVLVAATAAWVRLLWRRNAHNTRATRRVTWVPVRRVVLHPILSSSPSSRRPQPQFSVAHNPLSIVTWTRVRLNDRTLLRLEREGSSLKRRMDISFRYSMRHERHRPNAALQATHSVLHRKGSREVLCNRTVRALRVTLGAWIPLRASSHFSHSFLNPHIAPNEAVQFSYWTCTPLLSHLLISLNWWRIEWYSIYSFYSTRNKYC